MATRIRRVVTGNDANGKATLTSDSICESQRGRTGDVHVNSLWMTDGSPPSLNGPDPVPAGIPPLPVPKGATFRIMEIGPSAEICGNPRHPYTEMLISAVPDPDPRARRKRIVPEGEIASAAAPPSGCVFRTRCPYAVADCAAIVPSLRQVAPDHYKACIRDDVPFNGGKSLRKNMEGRVS